MLLVAGSAFAAFCDASDFGFSPDASGTENTVALQRALDRGGTVTVGRPGRYKVAGTVYIGDDTSLVCGSGVVFDNVRVLHDGGCPFLLVATPVDSVAFSNCSFGNGGVEFLSNDAMSDYGYGRTRLLFTGCRFRAKGAWTLVKNPILDKEIDLKTYASVWDDPGFRAVRTSEGAWSVVSDLPGLCK